MVDLNRLPLIFKEKYFKAIRDRQGPPLKGFCMWAESQLAQWSEEDMNQFLRTLLEDVKRTDLSMTERFRCAMAYCGLQAMILHIQEPDLQIFNDR